MTAVWRLDLDTWQLDEILQESLLHLGRNLIELIQIDEQELAHSLQHLAPLIHHSQEPGVEPAFPVWTVSRHGTSQGTDMVLAIPLIVAAHHKIIHRIILLDEGGIYEILHIPNAHIRAKRCSMVRLVTQRWCCLSVLTNVIFIGFRF